ncbi:trypsin-like peptidase domain-containing protein [Oerskovia flava]|uniref:trypsin-like peptidase domain-containing protein n=1 Tax=Oerskovia flava TaxID=2986422 RepID=UPI00223F45D7|nr:trypsin-like peptidase domain-containing protein [Oerskovia sp. JB1-3-2]
MNLFDPRAPRDRDVASGEQGEPITQSEPGGQGERAHSPDAAGSPSPFAPPSAYGAVRPDDRSPERPADGYAPSAAAHLLQALSASTPANPADERVFGPVPPPPGAGAPPPPPPSSPAAGYAHPAPPPQPGHAALHPPHGPAPSARARRGLGAGAVAAVAGLALVAGAVGGVAADRFADGFGESRPVDAALPVPSSVTAPERPRDSVAGIAASVLPSVVSLQVQGSDGLSTGSGFVLREDGYILTNNHVVAGAADDGRIVVLFADGRERPATLVGRTVDYDLAVVKVAEDGLTPLVLGDSDGVVVGDTVVAVGAPLGLDGTVTTGIVSALNRPVSAGDSAETAFINAIQTDAAINPGNSGGPLVDAAGQVVGINSAIAQPPGATSATGSIGLGFAIPSNQARRTAEQLIESGAATYPVIGVLLDQRYQGEGVQVSTQTQEGNAPVTSGGPAEAAGIAPGDVILSIDGRPVTDPDQLIVAIRAKAPGETVTLRVRTGEQERDVRVVLDEATSE